MYKSKVEGRGRRRSFYDSAHCLVALLVQKRVSKSSAKSAHMLKKDNPQGHNIKQTTQQNIFELLFPSVSKRVLVHNLSYGNEFDLQDNELARKSHFKMKGCTPRLVLKPT